MSNYIFPELPYYKKGWVPVLEAAKDLIKRDEAKFLCIAVSASVVVCSSRQERVKWTRLADSIRAAISDVLGDYITVSTWHRDTFNKAISEHRVPSRRAGAVKAYRLAWIDHIIARCEE